MNSARIHPREAASVGDGTHEAKQHKGKDGEGASILDPISIERQDANTLDKTPIEELPLEDQLLLERTWPRWHGMSILEETMKEILRIDTRLYHSWAILALDRGIIQTTEQLTSVMDTLSIISGLFVILCFQFLYSPPGGLLEEGRDEASWMVVLFNVSNILAVTFYFLCIMFGSLSGTAFRFSLRDVDKLRVLMLTNGASPSSQLFAMGYACASVAAGAAACGAVGVGTGAAIAVTAGAIGLMAYIFSVKLLHTGHVRYAWKEGRMGANDPADFRLILSRTMRLCAIDREYRAGRYAQALDLLRAVVAAEQ